MKKKTRLDKVLDKAETLAPLVLFSIAAVLIIVVAVLVVKQDTFIVQPPDITIIDVQPTPGCVEDEVLTFGGECKHVETFETEVLIPIPVYRTPELDVELPETGRNGR